MTLSHDGELHALRQINVILGNIGLMASGDKPPDYLRLCFRILLEDVVGVVQERSEKHRDVVQFNVFKS